MSDLDLGQMAIMHAIISDPEHRKRLDAMRALQEEINKAREEAQVEHEKHQEILAETKAATAALQKREAELAKREAAVIEKGNAAADLWNEGEKRELKWGEQHSMIQGQRAAKETELNEREAEIERLEQAARNKHDALNAREKAMANREQAHQAARDHAKHILAALGS